LLDTEPVLWRDLEVSSDLRLDQFHDVLQAVVGWTDSHLHHFYDGEELTAYFLNGFDVEEGDEGRPEAEVRLGEVLVQPGDAITYEYDFGDGWLHRIELVVRVPGAAGVLARCLDGALACPPEDCGGPPGYAVLAAWVRSGYEDSKAPDWGDPRELREWLPARWHPDEFSVDQVNQALRRLD
jgi:hypothetical protein